MKLVVLLIAFLLSTPCFSADYLKLKQQVDSLGKQYAAGHLERPDYDRLVREKLGTLKPEDANVALLKKQFWASRSERNPAQSDFIKLVDAFAGASDPKFHPQKADQALMKKILARREFVVRETSTFWEMVLQRIANWIERFFSRLPNADLTFISHAVLIVALIGLILLLAYFIYRSTRSESAAAQLPDIHMITQEMHLREPEFYRRLAEEAFARGEYRLSLRHYFYAIISALNRANLIPFEPSRTNREYWYAFQMNQQDRDDVRKLRESITTYETYWYGDRAASSETVTAFRDTTEFFLQKYQ